ISTSSNQNLINSPEVLALMLKEVERLNVHFGKWEQIKKIRLLSEEWTIESGMLTPTLKLKRKFLYARFKEEIADILQG
ncbi:MAG TPA: hypothetical protein PLR22_05685, partial [Saprospiraceae bacterium]|nr:hypothetical protein [Saprospiraceae bacterium]